jgi:hypothetical protein
MQSRKQLQEKNTCIHFYGAEQAAAAACAIAKIGNIAMDVKARFEVSVIDRVRHQVALAPPDSQKPSLVASLCGESGAMLENCRRKNHTRIMRKLRK